MKLVWLPGKKISHLNEANGIWLNCESIAMVALPPENATSEPIVIQLMDNSYITFRSNVDELAIILSKAGVELETRYETGETSGTTG